MKPKSLRKKPMLNKKTVANLKDDEMKKLKGGDDVSTLPLVSCINTITNVSLPPKTRGCMSDYK